MRKEPSGSWKRRWRAQARPDGTQLNTRGVHSASAVIPRLGSEAGKNRMLPPTLLTGDWPQCPAGAGPSGSRRGWSVTDVAVVPSSRREASRGQPIRGDGVGGQQGPQASGQDDPAHSYVGDILGLPYFALGSKVWKLGLCVCMREQYTCLAKLIPPVAEAWVLRKFLRSLETLDKNEWQVQSRQPQVAGC